MKCFTCKTEMKCTNDVVYDLRRIDWLICPKCGSVSEIIYDIKDNFITGVTWYRDGPVR